MKWILYLSNSTELLCDAFYSHGEKGVFRGSLFPEIVHYHRDTIAKVPLTAKRQIEMVNTRIEIYKDKETPNGEFIYASHSEYVFNALRHAVWNNILNPEDVEIRWLDGSDKHPYVSISIDKDGKINHWPSDMFSENEKVWFDLLGPKPELTATEFLKKTEI